MHEIWIKNYEKGQNSAVSFFDLSAAFDTLCKDIFCSKLKLYGFNQKSVDWFHSYLSDRHQIVKIGACLSEKIKLNVGSPQGAILSPTIFIILIADIGLWSNSTIFGYADDTTATQTNEDIDVLVVECETEAKKIIDYMSVNRLAANDDKTHIMIIRRKKSENKISVKIGNKEITETSNEKLF